MPPSQTSRQVQDALLKHLEAVFALAQILASDPDEAVRLVQRTYERAFSSADQEIPGDDQQVHLFRLLLQLYDSNGADRAATDEPASSLGNFRRRLAVEFVDHTLPAAFAALSAEQRLLLMLGDVQDLDCLRIGEVLDVTEEEACTRLEDARRAIREAVNSSATRSERHLMESGLDDQWVRAALRRMAESELGALPPTVRPTIMASIRRTDADDHEVQPAQEPSDNTRGTLVRGLLKRAGAILLIVAVAGLLGYGFSSLMRQNPKANLISLSAGQALDVQAGFQTASAEQAERYVYDRLGRRITVPTIDRAALQGVSIRSISDGAEVPVLIYQEAGDAGSIVVYVYSYAFLDRFEESLVLDPDVLRQIEEEGNFDLHDLGEEKALVWRRSDDILVAVTAGDAEELRQRIDYPA